MPETKFDFEVRDCGYETECWVWLKWKSHKGYGKCSLYGRKRWAHRAYYEIIKGVELEEDEHLDHLCENESCVNPDHLQVVSNLQNQKNRAKMTEERAMEIVALKGVKTQREIAREFGISRGYVADIHTGRIAAWR